VVLGGIVREGYVNIIFRGFSFPSRERLTGELSITGGGTDGSC